MSENVMNSRKLGQLCGSGGGGAANWARATQFAVFVLKKVFRVWLGVYVGDLFCIEPEATIESARISIKCLCNFAY